MNASLPERLRTLACVVTIGLILSGCSEQSTPTKNSPQDTAESPPGFVNIVWKVSESSSVAPGTLYIFLSEGTLLVASPHGKPALGTWKDLGGVLTMGEEGIPYQVDVLGLTQDQFNIRSHNPAKPAEITLIAAERPSR